jgi:hypothetical protein
MGVLLLYNYWIIDSVRGGRFSLVHVWTGNNVGSRVLLMHMYIIHCRTNPRIAPIGPLIISQDAIIEEEKRPTLDPKGCRPAEIRSPPTNAVQSI